MLFSDAFPVLVRRWPPGVPHSRIWKSFPPVQHPSPLDLPELHPSLDHIRSGLCSGGQALSITQPLLQVLCPPMGRGRWLPRLPWQSKDVSLSKWRCCRLFGLKRVVQNRSGILREDCEPQGTGRSLWSPRLCSIPGRVADPDGFVFIWVAGSGSRFRINFLKVWEKFQKNNNF